MLTKSVEQGLFERVGRTINRKYRLDAMLGAGGMGAVYSATHRNGARAALKFLHMELSGNLDIRQRFQREAYVANQIVHPGIVRVIDDDVDEEGCAYLVMDLLVGQTLEERRCGMGGRLPVNEVLSVSLRILDTLAAAHARGIVHRDMKPDNVFLTTDGGLKVMDFGVARSLDGSGGTRSGILLGTPAFMPPEQAAGRPKEIDERTDVWAVGAVMFDLLTGEEVHVAPTRQMQLITAATQPARSVTTCASIPAAVAHVVDTALAFASENRWQTAGAMRDALAYAMRQSQPEIGSQPSVKSAQPSLESAKPVAPVAPVTGAALSGPPRSAPTLIMGSVSNVPPREADTDPERKP